MDSMAELAAARAPRGAPLKVLKIGGIWEPVRTEVTAAETRPARGNY